MYLNNKEKELQEIRALAFARAAVKKGVADNTALDYCDGDLFEAAKMLDLDVVREMRDIVEARRAASTFDR